MPPMLWNPFSLSFLCEWMDFHRMELRFKLALHLPGNFTSKPTNILQQLRSIHRPIDPCPPNKGHEGIEHNLNKHISIFIGFKLLNKCNCKSVDITNIV